METPSPHPASFRDPSGYVFCQDGKIFRAITPCYFRQYDHLTGSGLYDRLVAENLLIPHKEIERTEDAIILEAEKIPFITYPCEWSFEQYRDAALLTLAIQKVALDFGMVLKDATAFNVAFRQCRPCFIDTLSFDFYEEGRPWHAYGQFCSHFFAPLLLAKYSGKSFLGTMAHFIDGVPLKVAAKLLPFRSRFNPSIYSNIHLPAKFINKYEKETPGRREPVLSLKYLLNIVDNLTAAIKDLRAEESTEWGSYYTTINYGDASFCAKKAFVQKWVSGLDANSVWDIGGNDGCFARILGRDVQTAIVSDIDPDAVAKNYRVSQKAQDTRMVPLVADILNPTPATGFENLERTSFLQRLMDFKPDISLALALIHHLTLSGNVPFRQMAKLLAGISPHLIVEFPDREDSKVQEILSRKRQFAPLFEFYTLENFEKSYLDFYQIEAKVQLPESCRYLYLMKSKNFN